jgi:hypothetical protein
MSYHRSVSMNSNTITSLPIRSFWLTVALVCSLFLLATANVKATTYGCYTAGATHPTRAPSDTRIVNGLGDCIPGESAISWDVFAVGAIPANINFDGANLWISNAGDGTITKLRPSDGAVLGTFQVGPAPGKSIRMGDSVWIADSQANTLWRIDANTGALIQTYPVRRPPVGMVSDGTNLWVSYNSEWAVGEIDPNTGQELAIVDVPDAFDMVFDGANVWVANKQASGKLTKIRASDASIQQVVDLGESFPWSMTFDGANIWVNCTGTTALAKVRVSDGAVVGAFSEDFYGFGAAFDGQNVWVPNQTAVLKFRASDGALRGSFPGSLNFHGNYMSGAAFDGTDVWITSLTNNTVTRYHDYGASSPTPTPTPCTPPPPDAVSRWSAEGNANDIVGGNNGTLQNGATFASGEVGQAFSFDGVNQGVLIGAGALPDIPPSGQFTVDLWLNPSNTTGVQTLFQRERSYLYTDNGVIKSFVGSNATDTGITAPAGQWTHAALTYNNGAVNIYVNGTLAASSNRALEDQAGFATSIGYDAKINSEYFAGLLDEIQFFDRALRQAEIQSIYAGCDLSAPVTAASLSQAPNAAGWNNSNVTVSLSATDESGGSGVASLTFSATGAQAIAQTTLGAANANIPITSEGTTTITYFARDNAGNTETAQNIVVRMDKTAPTVSCSSADSAWHASDVSIPCNAGDAVSGLTDAGDSNFNLTTSVPANTETSNAITNSRTVCDTAGNCATAGPISGNKVDKKSPLITITAPTAGNYLLNQVVSVQYTCTDGGSGVANCAGTSANGGALDTTTVGTKSFTVNATDNVGNSAVPVAVNYTVRYGIVALFDQTKAAKSGSTIPIKIALVDANGVNISSSPIAVHAVSVVQISNQSSANLQDSGNANPDFDFRYDPSLGGYIFNLQTTGYGTGNYLLNITAGGGSTIYSVGFQVRQ